MLKEFYRFRRIENLIGEFKELENQSIYFAEPDSLNDPIEGYRDLYWSGDFIVWRNLFRHYLLCLERLCSLLVISGEEHPISKNDIPVFFGEDDFPTTMYREIFSEISRNFFDNNSVISLVKSISERSTPVRREELFYYLRSVHGFALETILSEYDKNGLIEKRSQKNNDSDKPIFHLIDNGFIDNIENGLSENYGWERVSYQLFLVQKNFYKQLDLIHRYNKSIDTNKKNKNLVTVEFTEEYISQLERLVFPEWYTASFVAECNNSSVWAHYAEDHSGVCLIFSAEEVDGKSYLSLKGRNGYSSSGPTYGFSRHEFYPIDYVEGYGQIDFFRMLGRLPVPKLNNMWYMLDGVMSSCADDMLQSEGAWRSNYWKHFYRDITKKSKDWSYENENRLILSSSFNSFYDRKDRALTYDFSSLKGIIFGIKTKTEDKLAIIKIIEDKCKAIGRNDFKFYQASYSSEEKCITYSELSLLRFSWQD